MNKIDYALEVNILVALAKAMTDQTRMVNGIFKFKLKQDFNAMQKSCENWLETMEKTNSLSEEDFLEQLTDQIHNTCAELKKQMRQMMENGTLIPQEK